MTPDEMELAERCHTDACDHLSSALLRLAIAMAHVAALRRKSWTPEGTCFWCHAYLAGGDGHGDGCAWAATGEPV